VLGLTTFLASAYHWWFDLVNDTGSTIVSVRATNIDDPSFHGRDLLGDYIFRPGQHMRIEPVRTRATAASTGAHLRQRRPPEHLGRQSVRSHPGGDPRRGRSLRGLTSGNDEACRARFKPAPTNGQPGTANPALANSDQGRTTMCKPISALAAASLGAAAWIANTGYWWQTR